MSKDQSINPDQIFTVYQSLQDEYVAKNLELDLGSLTQFLDLKSTDSTPTLPNLRLERRLNRKLEQQPKKSELQEEKDLENPKMIVGALFKDVFGQDIDDFEMAHSTHKLDREFKFQDLDPSQKKYLKQPLKQREEIFKSEFANLPAKQELKLKIQDAPQQRSFQVKASASGSRNKDDDSRPGSNQLKVSQNFKQFFSPNSLEVIDQNLILQLRLEQIIKLKNRYNDLQNGWNEYWADNNVTQSIIYQDYLNANKKQQQLQQEFQTWGYQEPRAQELYKQIGFKNKLVENEPITIFKLANPIIFRNKILTHQHIIYMAITFPPLINLIKLELVRNQLSDVSMKIIISLLGECSKLDTLNLSQNQLSNTTSYLLCQQLKTLSTIRTLKLAGMSITTKMFLELCLSLVESKIQHIDFSHNLIDQNGYEAIETLLKYMKSLETADFQNNQILDHSQQRSLWMKKMHSMEHLHKVNKHYSQNAEKQLKI